MKIDIFEIDVLPDNVKMMKNMKNIKVVFAEF